MSKLDEIRKAWGVRAFEFPSAHIAKADIDYLLSLLDASPTESAKRAADGQSNTFCGVCQTNYLDESGCDPCPKCSASYGSQIYPVCHACGALVESQLTPMKCDDGQIRPFHEECAAIILSEMGTTDTPPQCDFCQYVIVEGEACGKRGGAAVAQPFTACLCGLDDEDSGLPRVDIVCPKHDVPATPSGEAETERKLVLEIIERFQREPKRKKETVNALEWLRREIEAGNHSYHAFEVALSGPLQDDQCARCGLAPNAIMHMAALATPSPAATLDPTVASGEETAFWAKAERDTRAQPDAIGAQPVAVETERCVKCGHDDTRDADGRCLQELGSTEPGVKIFYCGCKCEFAALPAAVACEFCADSSRYTPASLIDGEMRHRGSIRDNKAFSFICTAVGEQNECNCGATRHLRDPLNGEHDQRCPQNEQQVKE